MGRKLQLTLSVAHYLLCAAIVLAAVALRWWVVEVVTITSDGCQPALLAGDRVAINKRAYDKAQPAKGDFIIFTDPRCADSVCVGCITALPGDTLWIDDNGEPGQRAGASDLVVVPRGGQTIETDIQNIRLYNAAINSHEPANSAIVDDRLYIHGSEANHYRFTHSYYWISTTPEGIDSRHFGLIPSTLMRGKVWGVLYSHDPACDIFHGWRRGRFLLH